MKVLRLFFFLVILFNSLTVNSQWQKAIEGDGSINEISSTNFIIVGNNNNISGFNYIYLTVSNNQTISFDWSYSTVEDPAYDPFVYSLNDGPRQRITNDFGSQIQGSSNKTIVTTSAGVLKLGILSLDGLWGSASVIISNLRVENDVSLNITPPVGTLTSSCAGVPSTPITFGVEGSGISSTVTVSAPAGFEIKTVSSTIYAPSVSLTPEVDNTVSSTLHIRLLSDATNNVSGTITALSTSGGTTISATTTVTSTIVSAPTFTDGTTYNLCKDATYQISLTVANSYNGWSTSSNTITVNNGYVTAGTSTGPYTVSYTDACAQTVSATVTVGNSDYGVSGVSGGQASYKISNSSPIPQGPTANVYVGYNGFNYYSATMPTNTGYYKANNQSGNSAGCPYPFYIFRCTTCPD